MADAAVKRPKRKRSRKVRTAVVSSEESSDEDNGVKAKSAPPPSSSSSSSSDFSDNEKDATLNEPFDDEPVHDALDLDDDVDDELAPPTLALSKREHAKNVHRPAKTFVGDRLSRMRPEQMAAELDEKQRKAFHALYMQSLTEGFDNELDQIRQSDVRLAEDTNPSQATGRVALLVDALSFGSEMFTNMRDASREVSLALPSDMPT